MTPGSSSSAAPHASSEASDPLSRNSRTAGAGGRAGGRGGGLGAAARRRPRAGPRDGLWEESVFRGYLQPALIARLGVPAGIVVTAVVYARWQPPHFHAVGMSARLAQGLLGALRGRDRSLMPPVLAHALYWSAFGLT